ncbi:hypothetical protein ACFQ1Q_13250 [Winogradskyella litorisediminis]|uniref:Uncharacterized protein n=1 Tax=Winogradskyella litorisediminis TaxID=1156618 RepID=A0ABW3N9N9_9FLAO
MKNEKLHNIKETGFKTPEDYFESFDDKLLQRLETKSILDNIKDEGFKTPEGYFDTVENQIFQLAKAEDKVKVVSIFKSKKFYYITGIAASLLLLFGIFFNQSKTEEISVDMVENYLLESDLNSYELADLLADANILKDDFTIIETTFEEENLEDYLLENADIESILE